MASPRYPVSTIGILFSSISNSLLSFISDVGVFPSPLFLRDCGFDPFCPSVGGSHRTMARCLLHQEYSQDRAAADAQRLWPGASVPQRKFT